MIAESFDVINYASLIVAPVVLGAMIFALEEGANYAITIIRTRRKERANGEQGEQRNDRSKG